MRPVVTVAEMRAIDAEAAVTEAVLIERAGRAVARQARRMLGGSYGRRVVVVCGKGNNGADGRVAARVLRRWGVRAQEVDAGTTDRLGPCHLVIDAAYGTGFAGKYDAPDAGGAPVLAVDIPSGVNGDTGEAVEGAVRATATVTFAALKPGLLLGRGPDHAGSVTVADIGLDVSGARCHVVEDADVATFLGPPVRESHKWRAAVAVVAGSPGMMGAASLVARAAQRGGAGMVRLMAPGVEAADLPIGEAVALPVPSSGWSTAALDNLDRTHALVVGPGLGRAEGTAADVLRLLESAAIPVVIDGDGLFSISTEDGKRVVRSRKAPTILTPHDGEFTRLTGAAPAGDRVGAARRLAEDLRSTVLLKGSTTVVADPVGDVLLTTTGDFRLATAGTGDVLSGLCGTFVARGEEPTRAAALASHAHGAAARLGHTRGLVAGDLPELVAQYLTALDRQ